MGKGYAEGPAAEERYEALERGASADARAAELRPAVFGSTKDNAERHFLGWVGEVDADDLFASGKAWGLTVRRVSAG
jgi:hypothetical protein